MPENPIFAINARVRTLQSQGADIVVLTAGEPSTPTADHIVRAGQIAMADPLSHRYAPAAGDAQLRALIASQLPGNGWTANDVLVTFGAKHALALALRQIAAGGEVLVLAPAWPGHAEAARAAGAQPILVPAGHDGRPTLELLRASSTPRTRAIVLASPSNPAGVTLPPALLRQIAEWAQRQDLWVISDDVYGAFDYSDTYAHIADVAPAIRPRLLVVDSVSKKHAMTGWRLGWLAGPATVILPATAEVGSTVTNVPVASQAAAIVALTDEATPLAAKKAYRRNRDRMVAALDAIPGVDCPVPDGGMFVFPSVQGVLESHGWATSAALAESLLNAGVAVVPGEAFGAPQHIRICCAVDPATLDTAIKRLTSALTRLVQEGHADD